MQCLKCGREVGKVDKCPYCGGPISKPTDSRFSTTIIESQDILDKMLNADKPAPPAPHQDIPRAPQAQRPAQPIQPPLAPQPPQAFRQQGQPIQPLTPHPEQPRPVQPPGIQQPPQAIPQKPLPVQHPSSGQPIPQGIPLKPQAIQPGKITQQPIPAPPQAQPYRPIPVQQQPPGAPNTMPPVHAPAPFQQPRPPIAQGQPPKAIPVPMHPIPAGSGQVKPPQQHIQRPISIAPMPPQKPVPAGTPPVQPYQNINSQPQIPRPVQGAVPQHSHIDDGITEPIDFQPPQRPSIAVPPPAPQYGMPPAAHPQPVVPPTPPAQAPMGFSPPPPVSSADDQSDGKGIELRAVDSEMELVSSDEFFAGQASNQYDYSSFQGNQNENLPPAFARAHENGDNVPSLPRSFTSDQPQKGSGHGWGADEFPLDREAAKKGPYMHEEKKHAGNEVTYKIITIAMTILAFFSLRIIDTLRIGINNPYDKIFFVRLLIFAALFSFTGYLFFIKKLGKKEPLIKTAIVVLFVIAFIGSFIGMSGVSTSGESNFFSADAESYYRLLENPKGIAKCPSFSPDGKMAVINYSPNNMLENTIHILKINLDNEDKPADKVELPATCNKQVYWISASEIIYPGRKVSPSEPFKFEVIEANSGMTNTVFTSFEYNFVMDYDYNQETHKIAASYANLIWILDLETGAIMPVTGLDILARQFETPPTPSDLEISPANFALSLVTNRDSLTDVPYLDQSPRFSKDGKTLFFVRTNPNNMQDSNICKVDLTKLDGTEKPKGLKTSADVMEYLMNMTEILTVDPTFYGKIAVSPSARFISCWVRAKKGDNPNIAFNENALVIFDTKEKALIRIFPTYLTEASTDQMDWSPDGKYLIADMNTGVNSIIIMIEVPKAIVKMEQGAMPSDDL